jgi:hypothetical protein
VDVTSAKSKLSGWNEYVDPHLAVKPAARQIISLVTYKGQSEAVQASGVPFETLGPNQARRAVDLQEKLLRRFAVLGFGKHEIENRLTWTSGMDETHKDYSLLKVTPYWETFVEKHTKSPRKGKKTPSSKSQKPTRRKLATSRTPSRPTPTTKKRQQHQDTQDKDDSDEEPLPSPQVLNFPELEPEEQE